MSDNSKNSPAFSNIEIGNKDSGFNTIENASSYIETLSYIRNSFYEAIESSSLTRKMIDLFENRLGVDSIAENPVLLAYYGATMTLQAKHGRNPFSRLSNLRNGLHTLNDAVEKSSNNFEIHFLRFSVLHHLPSFLGYGEQLSSDTRKVYELLVVEGHHEQLDPQMAINVMEFIIESGRLDDLQHNEMVQLYESSMD